MRFKDYLRLNWCSQQQDKQKQIYHSEYFRKLNNEYKKYL
jgi:hypothetical protein